ncbi:hypothetical protein LK996_12000 [Lysobacter sp. A6]|uniref:Transmembrane protein n=1 Tax=Noviluteimonas lactosilytica TaxID=2888523 RepID=A0ABS8JJX2_9GAMM|nr:hypothetical protein [Lysobacter lactosilyticus]MCC8363795.1 hypothetical protein [Lysobacter lactosilyticus]
MKRVATSALAPGLALAGLALAQPWLEQRMFTHMLVEIPLLFAIGAWAAVRMRRHAPAWFATIDANGLTGLTVAMLVSAFWMLPIALDAAVLVPAIGMAKVASVVLAGWCAVMSLGRARTAVQAFFVLNWVWMTGAVGAMYQQAPERLCNTYLQGDQAHAGIGLVVLTIVVAIAWMTTTFRDREAINA